MSKPRFVSTRKVKIFLSFALLFVSFLSLSAQTKKDDPLKLLQYRQIGPFRGGRVSSVAGVTSQPNVYYFGATGGGVWKTINGGKDWIPVSDDYFKTGTVGAIDVSESDPNTVYVGMGEEAVRGNVSHGDGVIKRWMAESLGNSSVWAIRAKSGASEFTRKTRMSLMSPPSDISGRITTNAEFFGQRTVVKPGKRFCSATKRRVPTTSFSTRRIQI